jgi:hypothetical protein
MEILRNLVKQIRQSLAGVKMALQDTDTRQRRRPEREVEWNGEMIGDLKRRSSDA